MTMQDAMTKAGYGGKASPRSNPRCLCCNLPVAQCKWVAQDERARLAARQSTWRKPVAARGGK